MAKETEALQKTGGNFLANRPSFITEGTEGHEGISNSDIKPPALKLAQSTSPETKRSKPDRFIEGLREGEFFNSLTKEIYGEDPIKIIVVKPMGHRNVEFDKDMKPVEFDIPDNDPRCGFTNTRVDGKLVRLKPKATKFLDFLIYATMPDGKSRLMTMALKSTQLRKGVEIGSIIRGNTLPCYAYEFTATPVPENFGDKSWYGWKFEPGWPTEERYAAAAKFYEQFKGAKIEVDIDEADAPAAAVSDDDIPF
jgi:hypothetical protein